MVSAAGEARLAEKDFRLAKELDPGDPTAYLYSALHQWQDHLSKPVELESLLGPWRACLPSPDFSPAFQAVSNPG